MQLLSSCTPRERGLLAALALLTLLAMFGPVVPGPQGTPHFADGRIWNGLPNAMDVLSNLPFLLLGAWGLLRLWRIDRAHERALASTHASLPEPPADAMDCAWLFFAGLVLTAAASAFFHLQPDSLRLAADRAGMAVAFAGLIGLAVCERVSARAGWPVALFVLAAGLLAVAAFHESGDVLPWAVVQFGGMLLVLTLALVRRVPGALGLRLGHVIFFYALAKLFELSDQAIWQASGQLLSGHSLKHILAAFAALPVLHALDAFGRKALRHNPATAALTA